MHATRGRDSTCPACTEAERGGWTRHARCDGGPPGTRKGTGGQGAPRPCHFGVRSPRTDAPHRPCDTRGRAHAHTSQEGSSSTARSSSRAHHGAGPIAQAAEKQRRVPRRAVERGACWPPGGRRAHGQNHVAPPPHAPAAARQVCSGVRRCVHIAAAHPRPFPRRPVVAARPRPCPRPAEGVQERQRAEQASAAARGGDGAAATASSGGRGAHRLTPRGPGA